MVKYQFRDWEFFGTQKEYELICELEKGIMDFPMTEEEKQKEQEYASLRLPSRFPANCYQD